MLFRSLEYVVIGIGINVFMPIENFPEEITNIATTILDKERTDIRNNLVAQILAKILYYYENFGKKEFSDKYKQRSCILGKEITVLEPNESYSAKAIDIDEDCRLIIQTDNGTKKTLSNGEISVRL